MITGRFVPVCLDKRQKINSFSAFRQMERVRNDKFFEMKNG